MPNLVTDVRYALRILRRTPAFTLTALATLALCMGANLTIFAAVNAVLLRPLPFPAADCLVLIYNTYPKAGVPDDGATVTNYYERRHQIPALEQVAIYRDGAVIVGDIGATERQFITRVSPEFFATLGVDLSLGRSFTEAETTPQTSDEAIVTDGYWRERLAGDPRVLGRTLRVDGRPVTIVGVLPDTFRFLGSKSRIYFPLASPPDEREPARRHSGSSTHMIARLAADATLHAAQSQIDTHNAVMERNDPEAQLIADAGFRSIVLPLQASYVASVRPTLLLLQAGALVLLLIGAVNITNLFLIRAGSRAKELAVRQAIGASPRHVAGLVLVETMIVSLLGATLGLGAGAAGIRLLSVLGASRLTPGTRIAFDGTLAFVAIAASVVVGLVVAAPIVWHNLRTHANAALQSESRGSTTGRSAQRLRYAFLVAQLALAFVLLVGAGLLGISLRQVMAVAPGFRADGVLTGQVSLPWTAYRDESTKLSFITRLMERLARQPGVVASGIATNVPFSGNSNKSSAIAKGHPPRPGESPRGVYSYGIAGSYFAAMGMTLREGRFLTPADAGADARVCVVDADFARRYWPRGGALGHLLFSGSSEGSDREAYRIVGIVDPVKQAGLADEDALGAVYYPYSNRFDSAIYVVVRSSLPAASLGDTLQRVVRTIDPDMPVNNIRPMDTRIEDSLVARRSPAMVAGIFGTMALLLTALGTYGVLSYSVAQRRREIGLRMALGARPGQVRRQFVALALRLFAWGGSLGLFGAWASGRALQTILFHVTALDLRTLTAAAVVLFASSLAACLVPSHRAARISPMEALTDV